MLPVFDGLLYATGVFTPARTVHPQQEVTSLPLRESASARVSAPPRFWAAWTMLAVFIFIGFECILLAAAMKGSWLILMAPGIVCCVKAWDSWKVLKKAAEHS